MVESDFNPEIGERVEMFPYDGRFEGQFEIIGKHNHLAWGPLLDVKRLRDGRVVTGVETYLLRYPKEVQVRRAIEGVLAETGSLPSDFQDGGFDVSFEETFDGTPKTMVYFYLKPGVIPSFEKVREWNDFFSGMEEKLEPLKDSQWGEFQFSVKEKRRALSAAS